MKVRRLTLEEWRHASPKRRFEVPAVPPAALARLAQVLGMTAPLTDAREGVAEVIRQVREEGDAAVVRISRALDGGPPVEAPGTLGAIGAAAVEAAHPRSALELTPAEWDSGAAATPAGEQDALRVAAQRIEAFHALQVPAPLTADGLALRPDALERVGIYVPGGRARYPSTVLMNAIPARLAGVTEIVMTTPPGPDGTIGPAVLYAARLAGVTRVFRIGGAQAIAALAFGTESVPAVDTITGPGNVFVTLAKREVFGTVGIDGLAGPSEVLVLADESADSSQVSANLAAQLEHDPMAWGVLLTDSRALADAVADQLETDELAGRFGDEAATGHTCVVHIPALDDAVDAANDFAPEHLELVVANPDRYLARLRNSGTIFVGASSPTAMGDYVAGTNHTLPTGGAARFQSGLRVADFYRWTAIVTLAAATAGQLAPVAAAIARMEGLPAHERSLALVSDRMGL